MQSPSILPPSLLPTPMSWSKSNVMGMVFNVRGVEDKVASASTNILSNSLKTNVCVMLIGIVDTWFMEQLMGTNYWCCPLCKMALIFVIDSNRDSSFAIIAIKELTFASMVIFHFASNGGFGSIFTFLIIGCCLVFCCSPTNHTPMLMHSIISQLYTKITPKSTSFHSILPVHPFPFDLHSLAPHHSTRLTPTFT